MTNDYHIERWCVEVNRNLNKMRLSPFLVAVMAFATPLGVSYGANAQTANTSKDLQNISKQPASMEQMNPSEYRGNLQMQKSCK